jgi:hypothetical protein
MTRLPFAPDVFDGALSGYSLFHVDRDHQETAIRELVRVLRPRAAAVVLYGKHSDRVVKRIARLVRAWTSKAKRTPSVSRRSTAPPPPLYYHAHSIAWFRSVLGRLSVRDVDVGTLRLIGPTFSRGLVPDNVAGAALLRGLSWLEERFSKRLAPHATHVEISFRKDAPPTAGPRA